MTFAATPDLRSPAPEGVGGSHEAGGAVEPAAGDDVGPSSGPADRSDVEGPPAGAGAGTGPAAARAAAAVFALVVAAGLVYIQLSVPGSGWFAGDDWFLLTDGERLGFDTVFTDINGHWVLVPRAVFTALWWLVGLDQYWPYKLLAVASHGAVVVLLRAVMRRAGVRPWTATLVASTFLVLGSGGENILYPLQFALTASLACGLGHLLLADHVAGSWRRDVAGLGTGAIGLLCSGLALPMTFAVGLVVLARRGWRPALFHTVPVVAGFVAWASLADSNRLTDAPPSPRLVLSFMAEGQEAMLTALAGGQSVLALLFGVVAVAGATVVARDVARTPGGRPARVVAAARLHAVPLALWAAGVLFTALLARNIYYLGPSAVWAIRYVYIEAALGVTVLAAAGDAIARRVPRAWIALVVLALLAVPSNLRLLNALDFSPFDPVDDARVVRTAVRMPFARDVDPSVRPVPDDAHVGVTIGFLLGAVADGRLEPATGPLTAADVGEMRVRLGFAGEPVTEVPDDCRPVALPATLEPEVGDRFVIGGPVEIVSLEPGGGRGRAVSRAELTAESVEVQLPALELEVAGAGPLCSVD